MLAEPSILCLHLDKELEAQGAESTSTMLEAQDTEVSRASAGPQDPLNDSAEPYVELVSKMMDAFEKFDLWSMLKEEQSGQ